ncbi:MAG: hypothetical protein JSU68_05145 [Phycisphaerales bacterium]|nr:MAG: hypothetical protein JSU68_05145 [Phycisphaerales bacterium]
MQPDLPHDKAPAEDNQPTPTIDARRRGPSHKSVLIAALLTAAPLCLAAWSISGERVRFDFSDDDAPQQWQLFGDGRIESAPEGLRVIPQPVALVLSPALEDPEKMTWQRLPYVVVEVVPEAEDRRGEVVWDPRGSVRASPRIGFDIPPGAARVVLNARSEEYWNWRGPWEGAMRRIGLLFDDEVLVRAVTLSGGLAPGDRARLFLREFAQIEPLLPYSINFVRGVFVFGRPLMLSLGIGVAFVTLPLLWQGTRAALRVALAAGLVCFAVADLQFLLVLAEQVRYSTQRSAWHESRYDEYASRFGVEFADLWKAFDQAVPPGARVFVATDRRLKIRGESNWIMFQLYPEYEPAELSEAEYVLCFYPLEYVYEPQRGLFRSRAAGGESVRVKPIEARSPDAAVLQVQHD